MIAMYRTTGAGAVPLVMFTTICRRDGSIVARRDGMDIWGKSGVSQRIHIFPMHAAAGGNDRTIDKKRS